MFFSDPEIRIEAFNGVGKSAKWLGLALLAEFVTDYACHSANLRDSAHPPVT